MFSVVDIIVVIVVVIVVVRGLERSLRKGPF